MREYGPGGSSDTIRTSASALPPAAATRSASTTPVHSALTLQPSTQAIGSVCVDCGSAASSASEKSRETGPLATVNR